MSTDPLYWLLAAGLAGTGLVVASVVVRQCLRWFVSERVQVLRRGHAWVLCLSSALISVVIPVLSIVEGKAAVRGSRRFVGFDEEPVEFLVALGVTLLTSVTALSLVAFLIRGLLPSGMWPGRRSSAAQRGRAPNHVRVEPPTAEEATAPADQRSVAEPEKIEDRRL